MILEQHYLTCLAQASYLIGDQESGEALVVDPRRDVDVYLEQAAALGLRIRGVLLTHIHADFLAGHLELAQRTGATVYMGSLAKAEFPFEPLKDASELRLGKVRIQALETPGHTPESMSYLVFDEAKSTTEPHAILTGDTLFLGDVGRPDLMAGAGHTREELAAKLYDSLRSKILPLPDETIVYPGHGAGSACGKNLSSATFSSLGEQKRGNYALQPQSKEEFIAAVTDGLQAPPAYFPMTSSLNRSQHEVLEKIEGQAAQALDLSEVLVQQSLGAQVLDVRSAEDYAAGYLLGSINVGLDGTFASWAGQVLDLEAPVILVAQPGEESGAVRRLGRIGIDRVLGHLGGGPKAWRTRPELVGRIGRVDPWEADQMLGEDKDLCVIDVRQPGEVATACAEGSLAIPLGQIRQRMGEVPRDQKLLLYCKGGYRSMIAASLLAQEGISCIDLRGGFDDWSKAPKPI